MYFLLFFPSITFGILSAEIFPYAAIIALLSRRSYFKSELSIYVLFVFSIIYGTFRFGYFDDEILRSIVAYTNAILAFYFILSVNEKIHRRILKTLYYVFWSLLVLGLMQYSGLLSILNLDSLVKFLVPRGGVEVLGFSRGVTLLSTEPSRASVELFFIYIGFRFIYLRNSTRLFLYDLLFLLYLILIIKSFSGLMFGLLFLVFSNFKYFVFICIVTFLLLLIYMGNTTGVRALDIITSLAASGDLTTAYWILLNSSGFRGISLIASYSAGLSDFFGYGLGFWRESSVIALNNSGILASELTYYSGRGYSDYSAIRPTAFGASIALDMGIIGVISVILFIRKFIVYIYKDVSVAFAVCCLFFIFILGSIGNPIPWIIIAMVYRNYTSER